MSVQRTFSASRSSPKGQMLEDCLPLPLRICFSADLYPSVYFPDLTTSARRAAMDSVDLAAFDFFVEDMLVLIEVDSFS
jgi:hypothetical protein